MTRKNSSDKDLVIKVITVIISIALIFFGNMMVSKGSSVMDQSAATARAKVVKLGMLINSENEEAAYSSQTQYFNAKILSGDHKGETVTAYQQFDSYIDTGERFIKVGDTVILYNFGFEAEADEWVFGSFARFDAVFILGIIFLLLIILFGRGKGVSTVISLVFTCAAVFLVFIPSILRGWNIYLMTALVCVFIIIMTLLLTNGACDKTLTTVTGCTAGVAAAAIITVVFSRIMHLTGYIDEHSVYLQQLGEVKIDLKAIIFAMITIGAMGAVMDVAMDISSSLYEVHRHAENISFKELFKSGMNIGRDVMGTMANTLVLAYIGSSLCSILLRIAYANSVMELLNIESIVVELLQAITGSLGILLTIPLTALACCARYVKKGSAINN